MLFKNDYKIENYNIPTAHARILVHVSGTCILRSIKTKRPLNLAV